MGARLLCWSATVRGADSCSRQRLDAWDNGLRPCVRRRADDLVEYGLRCFSSRWRSRPCHHDIPPPRASDEIITPVSQHGRPDTCASKIRSKCLASCQTSQMKLDPFATAKAIPENRSGFDRNAALMFLRPLLVEGVTFNQYSRQQNRRPDDRSYSGLARFSWKIDRSRTRIRFDLASIELCEDRGRGLHKASFVQQRHVAGTPAQDCPKDLREDNRTVPHDLSGQQASSLRGQTPEVNPPRSRIGDMLRAGPWSRGIPLVRTPATSRSHAHISLGGRRGPIEM